MADALGGADDCWTHFVRLCNFVGRLCGSRGERRALDYARRHLESLPGGEMAVHDVDYPAGLPKMH